MKTPALVLAAVLALSRTAPAADPGDAPRAVVARVSDQVLAALGDKTLSTQEKRRRVEEIVYANTDFPTLVRLVLAQNYARFSEAQRQAFQDEFKIHLSVTYGRNVENYANERVQIVGARPEARGDWTVNTRILRGGPDDLEADYRLRQTGGEWKVIDVVIEKVSLVANFRSQFQEILANRTPEQLIRLLHEKNQKGETFEKR